LIVCRSFSNRNKNRLILLRFRNCNFTKCNGYYTIWCHAPHDREEDSGKVTYYTLGFNVNDNSKNLMKYFCGLLDVIKATHGRALLVVAGSWDGTFCEIVSKKQIYIVK